MPIDTEMNTSVANLKKLKARSRRKVRALSTAEKIRRLEALQERYFELLIIRLANSGRPIPGGWLRWKEAQADVL